MLPYYLALAAGIALGVVGQIALKFGSAGAGSLAGQFLNSPTLLGFAIYAAAAICYVIAIRRIPISLAYPSVSVSYVAVGLAAHLLWNEPFGLPQFVCILLIGGGILLLHQ